MEVALPPEEDDEPLDLAEEHIKEYAAHIKALNVLPASVYPRATQEISQIISMVEGLIDGDHAYAVDGDVFFRVTGKDDYGKLSGRKLEEMRAGARIDVNELKENPMDFVLWKSSKPGEPSWDSPWVIQPFKPFAHHTPILLLPPPASSTAHR